MKKLLFVMLFALPLAAQVGTRYDNIVIDQFGNAVSGATIRVCVAGSINVPCTPTATVYSDRAMTLPKTNPFFADARGNFNFYAPGGNRYTVQISGTNISTYTMPDQFLPVDTSGGGGGGCVGECWQTSAQAVAASSPAIGTTNTKEIRVLTNNTERFRFLSSGGFTITGNGNTGKLSWAHANIKEDNESHEELVAIGNGVSTNFTGSISFRPISPSSVTVFVANVSKGTDNGTGGITGAGIVGTGTINYSTGAFNVTFTAAPASGAYVKFTFTVTGNMQLSTTNTNAFIVANQTVKVNNVFGLGAYSANVQLAQLTTEHATPATAAKLGFIALQAKSDATDPLGSKKLYQLDSAGNEREFCYTDSGCSAPPPENPFGINLAIKGGWMGSILAGTSSGVKNPYMGGAGGSGIFMSPDTIALGNMYTCFSNALDNGSYAETYMTRTVASVVDNAAVATLESPLAAGCYHNPGVGYQTYSKMSSITYGISILFNPGTTLFGAFSVDVRGAAVQPMGTNNLGAVPLGATRYVGLWDSQFLNTATAALAPVTGVGDFTNFCTRLTSPQPGDGDLDVYLEVDGVNELTINIPAGSQSGPYCNNTDVYTSNGTENAQYKLINSSPTTNSGNVNGISIGFYPQAPTTAIANFSNSGGSTPTASSATNFWPLFSKPAAGFSATEAPAWSAAPRDGDINTFSCYVDIGPTNEATVVLRKNGADTALVVTIPALATGRIDGVGTDSVVSGDKLDFNIVTGSGTPPTVTNCSFNVE